MRAALALLLAITAPAWWHETNSHASSKRGAKSYAEQQYAAAAKSFERAQKLAPSPRGAFNLGTAQIATGQREEGSATITEAMDDPSLRPEALFNRGNSALAAKSFDRAVEDYIEALKLKPDHAAAKRNLEIALLRRDQQRRANDQSRNQNQSGNNQQQQQRAPSQGQQQQPPRGQPDLETLLRSVQQQEQEELRRMKAKGAAEGRVGW